MLTSRRLVAVLLLILIAGCSPDVQQAPPPVSSHELTEGEQFIPFQPVEGVDTFPIAPSDLEVGDCLEGPVADERTGLLTGVDCADAHTVEIFAIVDRRAILASDFPGETESMSIFQAACKDTYLELFGVPSQEHQLGLAILAQPDAEGWRATNGWIPCGVFPLHLHAEEGSIIERHQQGS